MSSEKNSNLLGEIDRMIEEYQEERSDPVNTCDYESAEEAIRALARVKELIIAEKERMIKELEACKHYTEWWSEEGNDAESDIVELKDAIAIVKGEKAE